MTLGAPPSVQLPLTALQESAVQLQELVVTGTGAPTQRRALGNAVATVSGDDVARAPATLTVGEALQGQISGAHIVQLPTEDAILENIQRQRRFELFLQGLRYSDMRRFGETLSFEWIPLPSIECSRNPSLDC